jgi:hypothetical protein
MLKLLIQNLRYRWHEYRTRKQIVIGDQLIAQIGDL